MFTRGYFFLETTSHQKPMDLHHTSKNDSRAERRALSQRSAQPGWATEFSLERARLKTLLDVTEDFEVSSWMGLTLDYSFVSGSIMIYHDLETHRHPEMIRSVRAYLQVSQNGGGTPKSSQT